MATWIVCDCEFDGPVPGINSLVSFGAVVVDIKLDKTFYREVKPISKIYDPEALAISGFTRKQHEKFEEPEKAMNEFKEWLSQFKSPTLISDNNGVEASWMNYYFWVYTGGNPFGHSSRRLADIICGFENDMYFRWKHLRKTPHIHRADFDAMGNAEVLLYYIQEKGLKIKI